MNYDLYDASKSLGRINLNLGNGMHETENYWCRVALSDKETYNPKAHRHSFFELHLCLEGKSDFSFGGTFFTLSRKEYLLFSPRCEHKIESQSQDFKKFIWGFSVKDSSLEKALSGKCAGGFSGSAPDGIFTSLDVILENAYERRFGYYDVIKGQLSNIFALIVRDICDLRETVEYRKKPSLIVDEIKNYISDNLIIRPSSDDIAAQFSRSAVSLDKLCIKECGMTVSALKKQLQFEKIKQLLSETDMTLDCISDICGFADRFTMGKFFKKFEGMPPGEFRCSTKK